MDYFAGWLEYFDAVYSLETTCFFGEIWNGWGRLAYASSVHILQAELAMAQG